MNYTEEAANRWKKYSAKWPKSDVWLSASEVASLIGETLPATTMALSYARRYGMIEEGTRVEKRYTRVSVYRNT